MTKKFKVFLPSGITQTIPCEGCVIDWDNGILKFNDSDGLPVAVFQKGGWYGMQDITAYKKVEV